MAKEKRKDGRLNMNRIRIRTSLLVAVLAIMVVGISTGCAKKPVTAPVPGSINTLDAWAFRIVADASASIHSVKTWEQCTEQNFPQTVTVDGTLEPCDAKGGSFPMTYKPQLNLAITSLNTASAAGKAYHSGASQDAAGLTAAVTQLSNSVSQLLAQLGGK